MKSMNNFFQIDNMPRNQTLIVVEGKLEKYGLLKVILKCFPELPIRIENVHIYENDIYNLYHEIEKEYGELWYEEALAIDIPLLISRKFGIVPPLEKKNFTNIIMMFDYEHHDNFFSDERIMKMQKHFTSADDDGFLYINYPMIESLYHYKSFPDKDYIYRSISVTCNPGNKYKEIVRDESAILVYMNLFNSLIKMLESKTKLSEEIIEDEAFVLLSINNKEDLQNEIASFVNRICLSENRVNNLRYSIFMLLSKQQYIKKGISYWEDIRGYFKVILEDNIVKASFIQEGREDSALAVKEKYLSIEWGRVLEKQNDLSHDCVKGVIMVLCTCITFLGEFKFSWNI